MAVVEEAKLREIVLDKYNKAKESVSLNKSLNESFSVVSDRIPGYKADEMQFGAYNKDNFVALFADMRKSSERAVSIGPDKTFLTINAIMPALIYIVEAYGGYIIDLPGDGVMALFKENRKKIHFNNVTYLEKESLAVRCGDVILQQINGTVNDILLSDGLPSVEFGVGIDSGPVIVTKIGTNMTYDTKAIGPCINHAAKLSDGINEIKITRQVYESIDSKLKVKFTKDLNNPWYIMPC